MESSSIKLYIGESLGYVSAEIVQPNDPKVIMTFAHGAGAGMNHSFMTELATALASRRIATLRFNFHYMEHGKKRPDPPPVAHKVISSAIEKATTLFPDLPVIGAGKSFGGRMTSQLLSKNPLSEVKAIVFYGFPLHPAKSPGIERADHLRDIKIPMLFLQGTKDALAEPDLIKNVCKDLPTATLTFIEGADHSLIIKKKDSFVNLAKYTDDWLQYHHII